MVTRKTAVGKVSQLAECDLQLIHACNVANGDPDVREIQREFDEIRDDMAEPWD